MVLYEQTPWLCNANIDQCVTKLCDEFRQPWSEPNEQARISAVLAHVRETARQSGPLNVRFARCEDYQSTPVVVAAFLDLAMHAAPQSGPADLIACILPVLRWEYGLQPLYQALTSIPEPERAAAVGAGLVATPEATQATVDALWFVGLLHLADLEAAAEQARDAYRQISADRAAARSGYAPVADLARAALLARLADITAGDPAPASAAPPDDKLWYSALTMAIRESRRDPATKGLYGPLLRPRAGQPRWPLPCSANDLFRRWAEARGAPKAFWQAVPQSRHDTDFGPLRVEFLARPLEILSLGNSWDTCMRLGGPSEQFLVGWAVNANVRVAGARAADGRVLARCTIGLSVCDGVALSPSVISPSGDERIETLFEHFANQFAEETGLQLQPGSRVCLPCAPMYTECFRPSPPWVRP